MRSSALRCSVPYVRIGRTIHRLGETPQESICGNPVSSSSVVSSKLCDNAGVGEICRDCVPSIPFSTTLDTISKGRAVQRGSRVLENRGKQFVDITSATKELYLLGCVWRDTDGSWKTTRVGEFLLEESRNNPYYSSHLAIEVLNAAMSREVRFSDSRRGPGSLTVDHRVCRD